MTRKLKKQEVRQLKIIDDAENGEFEIQKVATSDHPAKQIRFPKDVSEQYQLMPEQFAKVQNAIEEYLQEDREIKVYADSIENRVGYDSLIRLLGKYFGRQMAYYRSETGGCLPLDKARELVYRSSLDEEELKRLLNKMLSEPTDRIGFKDLLELNSNCPAAAQNLWEKIKRQARKEFESGHRAADALEPADYMQDAWNRASYLGLRESLCQEWKPKGGIELTMIDAIAQAWLQLQFWTKESVRRATSQPREENHAFTRWKLMSKKPNSKQWQNGHWDKPLVSEKEAIEQAAQMADRWQRMYFRAIRSLRDWRRYTAPVTINNPNQVNIATNGGQQINAANQDLVNPK